MPRPKYRTNGQLRPRRILLEDLQQQIAVRDMFGLNLSEGGQGRQGVPGVVSITIQLGDALLLLQDVPFASGHGFLCNRQVGQFHVSVHGMLLSMLLNVPGTEAYPLNHRQV